MEVTKGMTLLAIILIFLFLVIAAIIFAKNGKTLPMIACIAVAVVMLFFMASTFLLINGID